MAVEVLPDVGQKSIGSKLAPKVDLFHNYKGEFNIHLEQLKRLVEISGLLPAPHSV